MTEEIVIDSAPSDSSEALALIQLLDSDIASRYPTQPIHGLRPADASDPNFTFYLAHLSGQAVGCGALRKLETGVGEVKRMFVRPEVRGKGVARKVLARLEDRARELGCERVRLETGNRNTEAIALYQSSGYTSIPAYGEYIGSPISVCFEKILAG
jgi:putative acetyltransferase